MKKSLISLQIKPSPIGGKGIFTQKEIQPNQIVFRLEGPTIQYPTEPDWHTQPNALQVGPNTWKIPLTGNVWKYINHSCKPNAGLRGRSNVVAMRPIFPGEEVTIDYSITESGHNWHMRCRCGLPECRRVIKGAQYLSRELYAEYEEFIPTYLRQVYNKQKTYATQQGELSQFICQTPIKKR
ncbi:MAG: SET domain-containing protein-lysine N-methyltransferase [Patescibacteria group bacterium]